MIVVSNRCSVNIGLAIEGSATLYQARVPLIYDAERLLRILREEDYVAVGSQLLLQLYELSGRG